MPRRANLVSIITPAYNEEENLPLLYKKISEVLSRGGYNFELLVVENGSTDKSLQILKDFHRKDGRLQFLSLTRNFGHQGALIAGLEHCKGDVAITMDADLQHPPEVILEMLKNWEEGYDIVFTKKRYPAGQFLVRKMVDGIFYSAMRFFSGMKTIGQSDYRLLDRQALDTLIQLPERHKFLRGLTPWMGYPQTEIEYDLLSRKAGQSKFKLFHLVRLAVDGIFSFSITPLRIFVFLGFIISLGSFIYGIRYLILKIISSVTGNSSIVFPPGWATTVIVMLFLGGIQLMGIGLIGEYLGRVYDEVKGRPVYIVKEASISAKK